VRSSKDFINEFFSRAGSYVFSASVISRGLSFLASWIAIKLIPSEELGAVIYSFQIIAFMIPVAGLGLNQGLLRYGAQLKNKLEKNKLFIYTLKYGITGCFILIGILLISALFIDFKLERTQFYLMLLSLALISHYVFGLTKIQFLLYKKNKSFSFVELTYNILLVLLVAVLSYFYQALGYAIALIVTPLIAALISLNKLNINWLLPHKLEITNISFWKYGFFASMSNVTTQLLVSIDIILISSILNNLELVTAYKYVSLIPYSLLFLSQVVITTDFVNFTERIGDKNYIYNYIKNYMKIFSLISLGCLIVIYFFGSILLSFFHEDYSIYHNVLLVLTFGITGILTVRGVFGNLLSSIGKAHINFIVTSIGLLLNILLNYMLIPKYGLLGAAVTSAFLMWLTGILCALIFFYYYSNKKKLNYIKTTSPSPD